MKTVTLPDLTISELDEFRNQTNTTIHPLGCWTWTGYQNYKTKYGLFYVREHLYSAHRLAWEIKNDAKIPYGIIVMHKCDNPPCVNPDHLELGTLQDNHRDAVRKRRKRKMGRHRY